MNHQASRTLAPFAAAALALTPAGLHAQQDLVITGGHLIDAVADGAVPNPGLLVRAGKILRIGLGDGTLEADNARTIVLDDDEYIIPGLFDLHAHHAMDLFGQGRVDERTAYPSIFLANGVTSVFPGGEMNPVEMRELRMRIERGQQPGPRLFNSGPYFGRWRPGWTDLSADSIEAEVDYWVNQGTRGFKAKSISPKHLRALIEAAHRRGVTVTGHLDSGFRGSVNPRDAILMGIDRVEHFLGGEAISGDRSAYSSLEILDPGTPEFDAIAALYIRHGVFFDATLTAYGYYGERDPEVFTYFHDEMRYLTPYMREIVDARDPRPVIDQFERIYWVKRKTIKAFYDAGGGHLITLGTDHPSWGEFMSGFSSHRELHAMSLAGIPNIDVIRFGTINGARALGVSDRLGTIEAGKLADFFVVRGNPLEDIRHTRDVQMVIKGGEVFDPNELLEEVVGTIGPKGPEDEAIWKPRARG